MDITRNILRAVRRRLLPDPRFAEVTAEHFRTLDDPDEQKTFFARSVRLIEIEVHSFCNRTCWFCPNVLIDRRTETFRLDEDVYLRLLDDLKGIGYDGAFTFSRYCEPFGDDVFYERVRQAARALVGACIHTNTNGDYLNDETLVRAYDAGLRRMYVQLYLAEDDTFAPEVVGELAGKVRRRIPSVRFAPLRRARDRIDWAGRFRDMDILMYARNFRAGGVNRCGLAIAEKFARVSPCFRPFTDTYIDYNASVMPCCNLRSDYTPHEPAVWGTLDAEPGSIFRVFSGSKAVEWRRMLVDFMPKVFPCDDCTFDVIPDTWINRREARRLKTRFASLLRKDS